MTLPVTLADSAKEIDAAIVNLSHNDYQTRERATSQLANVGKAAVQPTLQAAITAVSSTSKNAQHETVWRAIEVLRLIAYGYQPLARAAAFSALRKLSNHRSRTLRRLANQALADYQNTLTRRAVGALRRQGARVYRHEKPDGSVHHAINIGASFKGKDIDLRQLARLDSLNELVLSHGRVSIDAIKYIQYHPSLKTITLAGYRVDDDDLRWIASMPSLESVRLEDCEISDKVLKKLKNSLKSMRIELAAR